MVIQCNECYMETMECKEWASDKYNTWLDPVLYLVSRPLLECNISYIA